MFFQSYRSPVMGGGLFGRGADPMMINQPSSAPILGNNAFDKTLKFAYQGYRADKNNPKLSKKSFFDQYGSLMSPGQAPNQIDGALMGFAQNNFNNDLFRRDRKKENFGFNAGRYGNIGDVNQYMAAANTRWR